MSDKLTKLAALIDPHANPKLSAFAVQAAREIAALQGPAVVPAPAGWVVAAPGSTGKPVTVMHLSTGIVLNIQQSGGTFEDYDFPDGGGDSTVLVGTGGRFVHDVTVRRARLRKVAVANLYPDRGKHGAYLDGWNVLLEDWDVECSPFAASCISIRFGATTVRRALLTSPGLLIGIYDSDTGQSNDGPILIEDVHGTFGSTIDTAVWVDAQVEFKQTFDRHVTFRNVEFSGPGAFLKASSRVDKGTFTIAEGCRLNGKLLNPAVYAGPKVVIA